MRIKLSFCIFENGFFDVMIRNDEGEEVTLSGKQTLSTEEFGILNKIAPSCVWTTYEEVTFSDKDIPL